MSDQPVFDRIHQQIGADDVVLYMKGTPVFPMCGFSAAVVQALSHVRAQYQSFHREGYNALYADGHVRFIHASFEEGFITRKNYQSPDNQYYYWFLVATANENP